MSNDLDTLLRASLQAEADQVVASDDLYARIDQAVARRPQTTARRIAPWVLVAAAAVVAVLLLDEHDEKTVVIPSDSTVQPDPSTTSTMTPGGVPRPDEVVAVLHDGRLVVLDVDTGALVRELAFLTDPRESEGSAEPDPTKRAISDAVVSPDGQTVYFGTSGGDGGIYRVPTDGSAEPERLTYGWGPTVSDDGERLAFAYTSQWGVLDLRTGESVAYELPQGESSPVVSISPDGTEVAVSSFDGMGNEVEHQRVHTINERMDRTSTRDGSPAWQGTRFADASERWLLEIVEAGEDGGTTVNWGTAADGLTTAIPNPDRLVVENVDW